jgi:hypothetical protein
MGFDWLHTRYATGKFVRKLRQDMAKELIDQGHVASGNLLRSLKSTTKETQGKRVRGTVSGLARGERLDDYQRDHNLTIAKIMAWMELKNSGAGGTKFDFKDIKEKRRIALAILSAAEDQGIPTRGAKKFSKNGRRVGWITLPYMRNISYVDKELIPKVIEDINYNFIKMLEELVAKNPNLKLIK